MEPMEIQRLAARNAAYLVQGLDLLERLEDRQYGPEPEGRGGVGAHVRHILDHYDSLWRGLDGGDGRVDYDLRDRDPRTETDRGYAEEKIRGTIRRLEQLDPQLRGHPVLVAMDCGESQGEETTVSPSTIERELKFLVSHTVHHYAIIALQLRQRGVEPGPDFGVAPSTLRYEQGVQSGA